MTGWKQAIAVSDIPRLGSRAIHRSGETIAIFRTADDEIFALIDRCPHRGGPLSQGIVHGCRVTCPLHGMVVDLATGGAIAPDEGMVTTIPVKIVDGMIWLNIADETDRSNRTAMA